MRIHLLALLVVGCAREPAPVPEAKQAPDTQGLEGHGGIAIQGPAEQPVTPHPAPAEHAASPAEGSRPAKSPELEASCGGTSPKDLYLRGYVLVATDVPGARELFRKVIACAPPDDEYHQKAQTKLEELSR